MRFRVVNVPAESVFRFSIPFVLSAICLYAAPSFLESVSFPDVISLVSDLSVWVWLGAALLSAVSFFAVGQYDVLARRQLDLPVAGAETRTQGMVAVALSQVMGFGVLTGSLVRFRLRRNESFLKAGQVTAVVSVMFLFGLAFVTLLALGLSGALIDRWLSFTLLGVLSLLMLYVCAASPRFKVLGKTLRVPTLIALAACIFWAAIDVVAAGAAFYLLLPADVTVSFLAFLPLFCIALAAAILSGVPGGVGPFELTLLGLTSATSANPVEATAVLMAMVSFRVVYYLVPALLAFLVLMKPETSKRTKPVASRAPHPEAMPRAETAVINQNGGQMVAFRSGAAALWPVGNSVVALFDASVSDAQAWVRDFERYAKDRFFVPALYKCGASQAIAARHAGWTVLKVAQDAIVEPQHFDTKGSKFSGLRRKLRKAQAAGLSVDLMHPADFARMAEIDAAWQARCGGARGGSMGRFCPSYLAQQLVLVALVDGAPVAFISLHRGKDEWALDLMRDDSSAPDGTMYLLVHRAIEMAAQAGVRQLSLAAVPAFSEGLPKFVRRVLGDMGASKGLYQFKSSFVPRWKPLYLAAPTRLGVAIAALDLIREIQRPQDISSEGAQTTRAEDAAEVSLAA